MPWQFDVPVPVCGGDGPCHVAEGGGGDSEMGRPRPHLQESPCPGFPSPGVATGPRVRVVVLCQISSF